MGVLYPILRFLYGATERLPVDVMPLCPSHIAKGLLTDAIGTIRFFRCSRCGSLRITSSDGRGRRWAATYTHIALDSRTPRSPTRICGASSFVWPHKHHPTLAEKTNKPQERDIPGSEDNAGSVDGVRWRSHWRKGNRQAQAI